MARKPKGLNITAHYQGETVDLMTADGPVTVVIRWRKRKAEAFIDAPQSVNIRRRRRKSACNRQRKSNNKE